MISVCSVRDEFGSHGIHSPDSYRDHGEYTEQNHRLETSPPIKGEEFHEQPLTCTPPRRRKSTKDSEYYKGCSSNVKWPLSPFERPPETGTVKSSFK